MVFTGRAWPPGERPLFLSPSDDLSKKRSADDSPVMDEADDTSALDDIASRLAKPSKLPKLKALSEDPFPKDATSYDKDVLDRQHDLYEARKSPSLDSIKTLRNQAFDKLEKVSVVLARLTVKAKRARREYKVDLDSGVCGEYFLQRLLTDAKAAEELARKAEEEVESVERVLEELEELREAHERIRQARIAALGKGPKDAGIEKSPSFMSISSQLSSVTEYAVD